MMATLNNYRLDGYSNFVLEFVYKNDLATTKSDALRMAIRRFAEFIGAPNENEYLLKVAEEKKAAELEREYKLGKVKTIPLKEFRKAHPEFQKYAKE